MEREVGVERFDYRVIKPYMNGREAVVSKVL